MADFSLSLNERVEILGPAACTYGGANVKGAYVQLVASTSFRYEALQISVMQDSGDGGGEVFLVDIATGPAGQECVVVPNILLDTFRIGQGTTSVRFSAPVSVPKGSRVSIRCQVSGGSGTRNARVLLVGKGGGGNYPKAVCGALTSYGAIPASTNGTLVDQGAVGNVWGAWTQITAATTANHNWIQPLLGNDKQTSATAGNTNCEAQIAVGPAGSEQIIWHDVYGAGYSNGYMGSFAPVCASIPAGSRISMRTKSSAVGVYSERHMTFVLLAG